MHKRRLVSCFIQNFEVREKFMEVKMNTLTPELFLDLYTSVGWEPPTLEQVKEALKIQWLLLRLTKTTMLLEW